MFPFVLVAAGGFGGAIIRYGFSLLATRYLGSRFPYGTLMANLTGAYVLGLVMGWSGSWLAHEHVRLLVATGVLGAETTFSTFAFETTALLPREWRSSVVNAAANVIPGLSLAALGILTAFMLGGG